MRFGEITLGFFRLSHLISPFGCLEHLICETLESVLVPSFVHFLGAENADALLEAFKFTWPGPVLLVASQPFHRIDRMIHFPLLVVALGGARLVHVAGLLLLLLLSCVECRLLIQGILLSDGKHCF
jgi:hypothetical protein